MDNLRLGEWDCKVFCPSHKNKGTLDIISSQKSNIVQESDEDKEVRNTRASTRNVHGLMKSINVERVIKDYFNSSEDSAYEIKQDLDEFNKND
jgi:hypothetical protein